MDIERINSEDIRRIRELDDSQAFGRMQHAIENLEKLYDKLEERMRNVESNLDKMVIKISFISIAASITFTAILSYVFQNILPGQKS